MFVLEQPFPTYPDGFPTGLVTEFARLAGRGVIGNVVGTVAAVGVALAGLRRRPVGNGLIIAGVAAAAAGSAIAGLGEGGGAVFAAVAAVLLYGGFVSRR